MSGSPDGSAPEDLDGAVLSFHSLPPVIEPRRRVRAARAAGFTSVGLSLSWLRGWLADGHTLTELEDLLAESGVTLGELETLRPFGAQPDAAEDLCWTVAERLRVPYVGAIGSYEGGWDDAVARFAALCDRAAGVGEGVVVGLEFLPFTNLADAATAAALVAAAGRPGGGVCVDVWHVHRGGGTLADLTESLWPHVVRLQLSDGPLAAEDDDLLADCMANRRPFGDGEFDLAGLLAAAARHRPGAGLSVEVISSRLRGEPPEQVALLLAAGLRTLLRGREARTVSTASSTPSLVMTRALEIGIVVDDLAGMVAFYIEALGCTEVHRSEVPAGLNARLGLGGATTVVWLRTPWGERVKLLRPASAATPLAAAVPIATRRGLSYLTLYVQDAAGVAERMRDGGASPLSDPPLVEASGRRIAFWADPEGNVIELVEDLDHPR